MGYPKIQGILQSDTPRWLKQCAQDTYFSLGTYKQTEIPIAEELCYTAEALNPAGASGFTQSQRTSSFDKGPLLGSALTSPKGSINGSNNSGVSRGSDQRYPH